MHRINKEVDGIQEPAASGDSAPQLARPQPDRHLIKLAHRRFLDYSELRLKRLKSLLLPAQRQFVEILPILFHYNHPLLPGYGPSLAPRGISGYEPDAGLRKRVENHFHGLKLRHEYNLGAAIQGIYLIGSSGTLAQSQNSDLDFWVCTSEPLSADQEEALEHKFALISKWAKNLKLEAHFFYMHESSFREQRRQTSGGENCGRTQHFLLLDEFYRSAIRLCGQAPMWWIIPDAQRSESQVEQSDSAPQSTLSYEDFSRKITLQKFIDRAAFIDFGDTGEIPFFEYLSASIWTLYKALQSPHKALIKLMLIESYVETHATQGNLSDAFKHDVQNEDQKLFNLDPYIQVYARIEQSLAKAGQFDRIELLRQAFYRKVDLKLSRLSSESEQAVETLLERNSNDREWDRLSSTYWRHALMLGLTRDWGWDKAVISSADNFETHSIGKLLAEQNRLHSELLHTYRRIDHRAREVLGEADYKNYRDSEEIELLDRHLKVVFRHSRGKVGYIGSDKDHRSQIKAWEHILFDLLETPVDEDHHSTSRNRVQSWALFDHSGDTKISMPRLPIEGESTLIKSAKASEELMLWLFQHGIAGKRTQFHTQLNRADGNAESSLKAGTDGPNLEKIARAVWRFYERPRSAQIALKNLANRAEVDHCLILVNSNPERLQAKFLDNVVLSDRDDPLSYTGMPRNTVSNLSIIWSNNWGEIFFEHFDGVFAVCKAMQHYIGMQKSKYYECEFECVRGERPQAVSKRLQQLFEDADEWQQSCMQRAKDSSSKDNQRKPAFVFSTADGVFLIEENDALNAVQPYAQSYAQRDEFWPIGELNDALLKKIDTQWLAQFDPISFPPPANRSLQARIAT